MANIPPPPALPNFVVNNGNACKLLNVATYHIDQEDELNQLVKLECEKENKTLLYKIFCDFTPLIQEGPTCGPVALSAALNTKISPENIARSAISKNWSNNGEIFSCLWMAQLAEETGLVKARVIKGNLLHHIQCINFCINQRGSVLVPYDKTQDYSPGLLSGKSAHWALINGLVILKTSINNCDEPLEAAECDCDEKLKMKIDSSPAHGMEVLVSAFQGLSRHIKLWDLRLLAASNDNLTEPDPRRDGQLVLPPGGVEAGLRCQAVLLYPKP